MARSTTTGHPTPTTMAIWHGPWSPDGRRPTSWGAHILQTHGEGRITVQPATDYTRRRPTPPCGPTTTQRARRCPFHSRHPTQLCATWRCGEESPKSSPSTPTGTLPAQFRQSSTTKLGERTNEKANRRDWICPSSFQSREAVKDRHIIMPCSLLRRWSTPPPPCRSLPITNSRGP
jgi:hypothetical protein